MSNEKSFGWTGVILRVNLSTRQITTQPTDPYKSYIGGMGIANKIMFDEVPAGTSPLSPENKIVFAVGPLTASGVPLAGRTTICSLSTFTKGHALVDAHTGGMIGAKIKQAGYDAIILEGKSETPVYIKINNDKVEIKDASALWGLGTRDTTEALARKEGTGSCVATIGPAGENQLPYAVIINSRNHSAGAGTGAVMGSKNCKALVVDGSKTIAVADPQALSELSDYMLKEIVGSNNNHVVPSTQQEWAEYYDAGSRWTAESGLTWALAEGGPIDLGEPKPGEMNTIGYRCMKATKDLGPAAEKYTIKMNGCHGCPIHCHADLHVDKVDEYTGHKVSGNTCVTNFPVTQYMESMLKMGLAEDPDLGILWNQVVQNTVDDLGIWCNYAQVYRDIAYCYTSGVFERVLPAEEYALFDWGKFDANRKDPSIMIDILHKVALNDSELARVAHGTFFWTERWDEMKWFDQKASALINYCGFPVHHANECFAQVGATANMIFNRDCMIHSTVNFQGCGLPMDLKKEIAAEIWGSGDALDLNKNYTPMNEAKAEFAWWSIVTDVLHDSLTLCNWVWPMAMSPTRQRDYRGDLDLEAKFYKAVTGEELTKDDLYKAAARIITLQRSQTVLSLNTTDLRNEHDKITEWVFTQDPDIPVFTEGTDKMDRDDFYLAMTMLYEKFHWDEEKGCPSSEALDYYDMADVKEVLEQNGLLA